MKCVSNINQIAMGEVAIIFLPMISLLDETCLRMNKQLSSI